MPNYGFTVHSPCAVRVDDFSLSLGGQTHRPVATERVHEKSYTLLCLAGKPTRALDTLYDVIKSKSKRNNTSSERLIEQIMIKYLELCVDLKKSHVAKEGLFQVN